MTARCCPSPDITRHGGNGRPKIILPESDKTAYYARPSSWGGVLEDMTAIGKWRDRRAAIGFASKPELLVSVTAHRDDSDPSNKKKLNELVDKARQFGGGDDQSDLGTALHKLTETLDLDGDVDYEAIGPFGEDLDAYLQASHAVGAKHEHVEHFMVNDELRAAGTPDRLAWVDGALRVWDLKTSPKGNDVRYPSKPAVQMAIYSRAQLYDVAHGKREGCFDWSGENVEIATDWGVLCELPAGSGQCRMWKIDLNVGWEGALLAGQVRDWRKRSVSDFVTQLEAS